MTKPYVHPVIPQADVAQAIETARLTIEAIRAAYSAVDDATGYAEHTIRLVRASLPEAHDAATTVIDDAVRVGAVAVFIRWLRKQIRRRRDGDDDDDDD